jgi:RNA polymerase sigma-70 factor, ECF subfamily
MDHDSVDVTALGHHLEAELDGLWRYARTLTRDDAAAQDLTQETVARALEKAATFRAESSLRTWLHRIMHHLSIDRARRDRETPVDDLSEAIEASWRDDAYTVDAEAVVLAAETRAELRDALVHLPFAYRTAVVLHDAEGLTVQQIATITDVSLPAAKQRLRRGRMMLVSQLDAGRQRRQALLGVPMRCWDARSLISDYLDGDLTADDEKLINSHLATCPTCPPLYAALVGTRTAMRDDGLAADPDSVIPPELAQRVRQMLI